jgi:peptidoglycan hydrolase-like protein with peptidoglycan-binding domain
VVTVGLNGHPIKTLQYLLRARGHSVAVDGDFGPQTNGAVKMFQTSKSFAATGTVDAQTWGALIVQVQKGSHGDAVRGVQEEFQFRNESGNPNQGVQVDGDFGPQTDAGVRISAGPLARHSNNGRRWSCRPDDLARPGEWDAVRVAPSDVTPETSSAARPCHAP